MKKICKNCKNFKKMKDKMDLMFYGKYAGYCDCEKIEESESPQKDGLAYTDYEGYSASFLVGEEFGCIHWEEKK